MAALLAAACWSNTHILPGPSSLRNFLYELPVVFSSTASAFVLALWFAPGSRMRTGLRWIVSAALVVGSLALYALALQASVSLHWGRWFPGYVDGDRFPLYVVALSVGVCWLYHRYLAKVTAAP